VTVGQRPSPEFLALQAAVTGRYVLDREIGRGGMGVVFLARDVALERVVAVKLLPPHLASDPTMRERFLREARTAAGLSHPNIVPIHAVEAHDDLVFFAMGFIDGETLAERVTRLGPLAPRDAVRMMRDVAWALAYAHERGVVHRDIKPENILLEHASGRALVTDFGIARHATSTALTDDGALVGTLYYMSPEQAGGEAVDARCDLWSLGATAYFALSGSSPVAAPSLPAVLTKLLSEDVPSISLVRPEVPGALADVVSACLQRDRAHRPAGATQVANTLRALEQRAPAVRPEVRGYLRDLAQAKVFLVAGLATSVLGAVVWEAGILERDFALPVVVVGAVLLTFFGVGVWGSTAALWREGLRADEIVRGITAEILEFNERVDRQSTDLVLQRTARVVGGMFVLLGVFIVTLTVTTLAVHPVLGSVFGAVGALYLGVGVGLVRAARRLPRWVRAIVRPGRGTQDWVLVGVRWLLSRPWVARRFNRGSEEPPATSVPTATLLARRVADLVQHLPPETRDRLGGLLPVANELERCNADIQRRLGVLTQAMAELPAPSPARGEFAAAKARLERRQAECVAALDVVRVDLLRISAGLAAPDGLTDAVSKARELSAAIDAELHGQDEVRRLVG